MTFAPWFTHVTQLPQDLRTDAHPCKNHIHQNRELSWWRSCDQKWTDTYLCMAPSRRSLPSTAAFPPKGHKWNNTWQNPPPLDLDTTGKERMVLFSETADNHNETQGPQPCKTGYGNTGEVMKSTVRVERCTWMETQPGGKHAHTFTAVLLLDLSNDAMVKWCVTKSILQEIWERKEEERMRSTCRVAQSLRGPIQDSPFSVSFTWFSHSSYLASSWNRKKRQLVTMATDSTPIWIIDTFQSKHFRCCNCNHNTTYMSTEVKVTCVKPEIDHI